MFDGFTERNELGCHLGSATDVSGRSIDAGHFLAEERPDEVVAELRPFFLGT